MEDLKRLTINLALASFSTDRKSYRSFDRSEAVGLGIVAAMSNTDHPDKTLWLSKNHQVRAARVLTVPMIGGSKSIPIHSSSGAGTALGLGNDRVRKREYFDDCVLRATTTAAGTRGVFSRSLVEVVATEETPFWVAVDFLSSCFLCSKDLRGIDIFMYRGEKALCSVECRDVQIATDKHKEKRGRVRVRSMEHSESPCCSPMLCYSGVMAA